MRLPNGMQPFSPTPENCVDTIAQKEQSVSGFGLDSLFLASGVNEAVPLSMHCQNPKSQSRAKADTL